MDQRWLEQALQTMEEAWPEGEEHMAKLSINALVGLFARNLDLVYSMRTSNHQVDGEGCSWRQTFTDAAGRMHHGTTSSSPSCFPTAATAQCTISSWGRSIRQWPGSDEPWRRCRSAISNASRPTVW